MQRQVTLPEGIDVVIRPVEPDDADLLVQAFEGLSAESRYLRFLTTVPRLPRHWVDELVDLDHRYREALGALDPETGEGIAVARYVRFDDDPEEADFAIAVADAWQGRGLGRLLLGELLEAARANGLRRLSGDVIATNERMLALGHTLGVPTRTSVAESGVVRLVLEL
jgi:acetyltransferase